MKEKTIRKNQIMLRFTDEEFSHVKQLHGNQKAVAVAIREYVLGLPPPSVIDEKPKKENTPHFAPIDPDFLRQVAGGMKNINRIATVINSNKDKLEKLHLVSQLATIENQLNELLSVGYDLSNDR